VRFIANGINGVTGQYDRRPLSPAELAGLVKSARPAVPAPVRERGRRLGERAFRALPLGIQPEDVAAAGWGVVFLADEHPAVKKAVERLVEHRRAQIGDDARVKVLTYQPSETTAAWLRRHNVGWHAVEPTRLPYYLLLVGSPERIPFAFIHELDTAYCVGLLHFDGAADYERYVDSVIEYEKAASLASRREAVFFGTRHPFDDATTMSADWLVTPLTDGLPARGLTPAEEPVATRWRFGQRKFVGPAATRQALVDILRGDGRPPALLFTATHGMVWPSGDPRQLAAQGALVCQDWPGFGRIGPEHYLAAVDVPDDAHVHGTVVFTFACYGAGTPRRDRFSFAADEEPPEIAPRPFLAALPRRLLSHPGGGALACIGHVERAWGYSIVSIASDPQIQIFQRAIGRILLGSPVGLAVQEFNDKCATMSVPLTTLLEQARQGLAVDDMQLASTWTERNAAEGYVLVGDPAVKLRVDDLG
jgi:hypothetical protein